jgi:uncharacterized protein (TIGR02186 family)
MNTKAFMYRIAVFLSVVAALWTLAPREAAARLTATANHDHISIDFLYHGSSVSVRGISDPGADLVIAITSADGEQALKKKGKVAGFLWMNVGKLAFEKVPALYFVNSTKNPDDILSIEEREKYGIGYAALEKHAEIKPVAGEDEKTKWFDEFIKLKKSAHLYDVSSGKIQVTEKDGAQNYYILCDWPYQAAPGDYTVTVYAVKDKKVVEKAEAKVQVEQVGLVKLLSSMAKEHGAMYGLISILAALGAGFGVGLVFRKGGGAH